MHRIVARAALFTSLALLSGRSVAAQQRPDFSGTWLRDAAASRMIGPGAQTGPAQRGERRIT